MKNKIKVFGLVIITAICFVTLLITGCSDIPSDNNGNKNKTSTPTNPSDTSITNVSITIVVPVTDMVPSTTASINGMSNFTASAVTWSPTDNPFQDGKVYTSTVTLTAENGYTFNGLTAAVINEQNASVSNNNGKTVTLSYNFPITKTVMGVGTAFQPSKLNYTQDETLNLSGLIIQVIYTDSSIEYVPFAKFSTRNITTSPVHGDKLTAEENNGKPITIFYDGFVEPITTNNLTVNPREPVIDDFIISGIEEYPYDGSAKTVTVTADTDKTTGMGSITVKYNNSTTVPSNAGAYPITFCVEKNTNYTAVILNAGTLIINKVTPIVSDYNISGVGTFTYNGSVRDVTVTAKSGKSSGAITVKYNNNTTAPFNAGVYPITFNVAEDTNWNTASLSIGTLTINKATPIVGDYNINGTGTFTYNGSVKNVTVTVKSGKSPGDITVKYNGNETAPTAGTYTVTFDVNADTNWNTATLNAGTLIINNITLTSVAELGTMLSHSGNINTVESAYDVKLNVSENDLYDIAPVLKANYKKYVNLDLSGNTYDHIGGFQNCSSLTGVTIPSSVTEITVYAFYNCTNLTSVKIPSSVVSIFYSAFFACSSLTSVTFQGTILPDYFSTSYPFPGDLREKYLAEGGGIGTYTTTNPGNYAVWTKQP